MPCRAPNHGTWENIDISDPNTSQRQQSQPAHGHPRYSSTRPPSSGYAYVPPFTIQTQPRPMTTNASNNHDANNGFTKAPLFPQPPHPRQHSYHTFPAASTTTTTSATATTTPSSSETNHPDRHEPCYFETLDFSDYQHRRPRLASPAFRSPADEKDGAAGDAYRPRVRGCAYYGDGDAAVTWGSSAGGVGSHAAAVEKRAWRAARQVVVVVMVWMLVVGGLVALQWVVRGGGRLVDDVNVRGNGDWEPCTEARPRFCRLVVGAEEQ
ncbi:hypothetical protein B0I37DRAFT_412100 [Chaetomium sp. MPI-CAGE-AT-0009]|nr:hypothetical protein B0I37DRAFT_412100 [Chaetomium sp. MPI-CAGE-AT-0009]